MSPIKFAFFRHNAVFLLFFIYLIIAVLVFTVFRDFLFFYNRIRPITIVEGVLQPRSDIPASLIFNPDPLLTSSDDSQVREIRKKLSSLVFSPLFIESPNNQIVGELVEEYTFQKSQTLNIKLRENVKWHDGEKLTATDVLFTFEVLRDIGRKSFYYYALNGGDIKVEKIDDYRLKIDLVSPEGDPRPNTSFIQGLTFPILPAHVLSNNFSRSNFLNIPESSFGIFPIGTGPLRYGVNRNNEVELYRFEEYFKGPVAFDRYILRFYSRIENIIYDYKLKNIDIFMRNDIGSIDEDANKLLENRFKLNKKIILNKRYVLYFNIGAKKSDDASQFNKSALLRKGLLNVINRQEMLSQIDIGREVLGPVDQSSPFFLRDVLPQLSYNPESFIKLVESLGYIKRDDGFYYKNDSVLKMTITYLRGGVREVIIKNIVDQLSKVGIKVNLNGLSNVIQTNEKGVIEDNFIDIVNNRNYDVLLIAVNNFQDPDLYNEWHSSRINPPGLNLSGFSSRVVDKFLEDSRLMGNDERERALLNFQRSFFEESPAIYLLNTGLQIFYSESLDIPSADSLIDTDYFYYNIYDLKKFIKI